MQKDEFVAVGKSLLWFLGFVGLITFLVTLAISAFSSVSFWQVLIWTSIAAVVVIILWQCAMWVPKNKGE